VTVRFLLDTNVLSAMIRDPRGPIRQRIEMEGTHSIANSIIVAAELRFGAAKSGAPRIADSVEAVLARIEVLPWTTPCDRVYGKLRLGLEKAGTPIGALDLLIAAQAVALGLTVVTANLREFRRVPGLETSSWGLG
jgi:tRNA(fMet)-specific endonuclease VapC